VADCASRFVRLWDPILAKLWSPVGVIFVMCQCICSIPSTFVGVVPFANYRDFVPGFGTSTLSSLPFFVFFFFEDFQKIWLACSPFTYFPAGGDSRYAHCSFSFLATNVSDAQILE